MNRSASSTFDTWRAPSRRQRSSRKSSISEGISGRGRISVSIRYLNGGDPPMIRRVAFTTAFIAATVVTNSAAVAPFPAYFTLPPAMTIVDPNNTVDEAYGEANMPFGDNDNRKRGRHFSSRLQFAGVESDENEKQTWRAKVWDGIRQSLAGGGWVVKDYQNTNPPMATLQYQRNGVEAWTRMQMFSPEQIEIEFIEVKAFTPTLSFPAPATTPEKGG